MTEFCALSRAESARHTAQAPAKFSPQNLTFGLSWTAILVYRRQERKARLAHRQRKLADVLVVADQNVEGGKRNLIVMVDYKRTIPVA
jgi:hypothetical protein